MRSPCFHVVPPWAGGNLRLAVKNSRGESRHVDTPFAPRHVHYCTCVHQNTAGRAEKTLAGRRANRVYQDSCIGRGLQVIARTARPPLHAKARPRSGVSGRFSRFAALQGRSTGTACCTLAASTAGSGRASSVAEWDGVAGAGDSRGASSRAPVGAASLRVGTKSYGGFFCAAAHSPLRA